MIIGWCILPLFLSEGFGIKPWGKDFAFGIYTFDNKRQKKNERIKSIADNRNLGKESRVH